MENQGPKLKFLEQDEISMTSNAEASEQKNLQSFPNQMENKHDLANQAKNWMKYDGAAQLGSMKMR